LLYGLDGIDRGELFRVNLLDGVVTLLAVIQIAVYTLLSFRHIRNYRQSIRQQLSAIEKTNLSWLLSLLWSLVLLWIIYVVDIFFSERLGIGDHAGALLHLILVFIIYTFGYLGLRQPLMFKTKTTTNPFMGTDKRIVSVERGKYSRSKLSDEFREELKARLIIIMEEDKPYLESGITLSQLSTLVDCTSNNFSQVINDELGKSFFDFINMYRINHAKRQLLCNEVGKIGILQIAMDAGFNSKSAFYEAFKKNVGMTPSQYRKIN